MQAGLRFAWDARNIEHLAQHKVRPEEAEEVLAGEIIDLDYRVTAEGEDRWTAVGETARGRVLVVVWTVLEDARYRAITAYPATRGLEAIYRGLKSGGEAE